MLPCVQVKHYVAAVDALEQWAKADGMERHEEQVNCFAHVAHARQSIAALQESAAAYKGALLTSKEKHAHLSTCLKVRGCGFGDPCRVVLGVVKYGTRRAAEWGTACLAVLVGGVDLVLSRQRTHTLVRVCVFSHQWLCVFDAVAGGDMD